MPRIHIRRVNGVSMVPTLKHGQLVVFRRTSKVRKGSVVIARFFNQTVVKRVQDIEGEKVFLRGDNSLESVDSREYGPVRKEDVMGRLVWPRVGAN